MSSSSSPSTAVKIVHAGVTEHPSAHWAAQRFVEATSDAQQNPRPLVQDRDSIYAPTSDAACGDLALDSTPPRSLAAMPSQKE
jgi:hypothetical protein